MNDDILNFDAKAAKELMEKNYTNKLIEILNRIKYTAETLNLNSININHPLDSDILSELTDRDFEIIKYDNILKWHGVSSAHYKIKW